MIFLALNMMLRIYSSVMTPRHGALRSESNRVERLQEFLAS